MRAMDQGAMDRTMSGAIDQGAIDRAMGGARDGS